VTKSVKKNLKEVQNSRNLKLVFDLIPEQCKLKNLSYANVSFNDFVAVSGAEYAGIRRFEKQIQ
jgi:hypothetical protein